MQRFGEFGLGLLIGPSLMPKKHWLGSHTTGKSSLSCAVGNVCAGGAVNLLVEIRYVRSSAIRGAADTLIDP